METKKEEIVLYIYHMNKAVPAPEEKNRPGAAGQREQQLSSAFLARAASHYAAQHCPAGSAAPPEGSLPSCWYTRKGSHGKPYFPDFPWLHFSVSHSGEYWACAMAPTEVGLDLQIHTKGRRERISARFFHPQENEYLRSCNYRDFFDVWAAKESYVKYTGSGIGEGFAAFTAATPTALAREINGVRLKVIPFRPDYSLCLCAPCIGNITIRYEV